MINLINLRNIYKMLKTIYETIFIKYLYLITLWQHIIQ